MRPPEYVPYIDDTMASVIGNQPYLGSIYQRAHDKARKAYEKALSKKTSPLALAAVPYGYGEGLIGPRSAPTGLYARGIYARGYVKGYKVPKKYRLPKANREIIKELYRRYGKGGKFPSYKKVYKYMKGRSLVGGKLVRLPGETPMQYRDRVKNKRRLLKSLYYNMRKYQQGAKIKKKAYYKEMIGKLKEEIKNYDPSFTAVKRKKGMEPVETGEGLIYGVRASGDGFMGALASAASPLIIEGVKWIAKKIGQRISRKMAGKGMIGQVERYPSKKAYPMRVPGGKFHFWYQVYKEIRKRIPLFFPNVPDADKYVEEFVDAIMPSMREKLLKDIVERQNNIGENLSEIIYPIAATAGTPDAASLALEFAEKQALQKPAGSGFIEEAVDILSRPEVKDTFSQAAKTIMPTIIKGLKAFTKSKFLKFLEKRPRLKKAASRLAPGLFRAPPSEATVPMIEEPSKTTVATGYGYGPTTADEFDRDEALATTVYSMSKNEA